MFKKKHCPKVVYDELIGKDEFLRITTNMNGDYVLLHCYGLAENGVTPLRSERICVTRTLAEAKAKGREIIKPPVPKPSPIPQADYSHIRLPYKD